MNREEKPVPEPPAPTASANPVAGQLLELEVSTIRPYDHNPRHGENPEYQRIKASVRAEGLDQPLVVTRRPGESAYMLQAGGNTRLRILQELYAETGDQRFARVSCLYRPWTREMDVLLAHLRENDLRSDLTFLDRALAVREARRLLEIEQGGEGITQTLAGRHASRARLCPGSGTDLADGLRGRTIVAAAAGRTGGRHGASTGRTHTAT